MRLSNIAGLISLLYIISYSSITNSASLELVTNGSFETGDFTGWNTWNNSGSADWMVLSGTSTPSGTSIPSPTDGLYAAVFADPMWDDGSRISQEVVIPTGFSNVQLSFDLFYRSDVDFNTTNHFPHMIQSGVVDIINYVPGSGNGEYAQQLFITNPGDSLNIPYTTIIQDITAFSGTTINLWINEDHSNGALNYGIDNVSIVATNTVPVPAAIWLFASGMLGLLAFGRKT